MHATTFNLGLLLLLFDKISIPIAHSVGFQHAKFSLFSAAKFSYKFGAGGWHWIFFGGFWTWAKNSAKSAFSGGLRSMTRNLCGFCGIITHIHTVLTAIFRWN